MKCPSCAATISSGNTCEYCGTVVESSKSDFVGVVSSKCLRCDYDNDKSENSCKSCSFPIKLKCLECSTFNHIKVLKCQECGSSMEEQNVIFESPEESETIISKSLKSFEEYFADNSVDRAEHYVQLALNEDPSHQEAMFHKAEIKTYYAINASGSVSASNVKQKYIREAWKILEKIDENSLVTKKEELSKSLEKIVGKKASNFGEGGCFIATASLSEVYSPDLYLYHPDLTVLRSFRDNTLSRYYWGKSFIKWYYLKGPSLADFIKDSKVLKTFIKNFFIKPLVQLIKLLKLG